MRQISRSGVRAAGLAVACMYLMAGEVDDGGVLGHPEVPGVEGNFRRTGAAASH
jgi:hypothetical protein